LSSSELELYAIVSKVLGNGMFYAKNENYPQLLGRIRNKFKGRSIRDNKITTGCVILVGLREWEYPNYKECDLLEVYDSNEIRQLSKMPSINFAELKKYIDEVGATNASECASMHSGEVDINFSAETDYTEGLIPEDRLKDETLEEEIVDADEL
jgi:translation initiation factor IF-1